MPASQVGERIKKIRESHSMTQEEFARILRVDGSHISRIERGGKTPSAQLLRAICREFFVTEDYLHDGKVPDEFFGDVRYKLSRDPSYEQREKAKWPITIHGQEPLIVFLHGCRSDIRNMINRIVEIQAGVMKIGRPNLIALKQKESLEGALNILQMELTTLFYRLEAQEIIEEETGENQRMVKKPRSSHRRPKSIK